jgi:hypothetical protein
VRASDGTTYSEWASGRFFLNLANDAPSVPQASAPRDGTEVDTTTPVLAALNSSDADGDPVSMKFEVFADAGATQPIAASDWLPAAAGGVTAWTAPSALTQTTYFWRMSAADRHGAVTETALLRFTVNPGNQAPGKPQIVQPASGSTVAGDLVALEVAATDTNGDGLSYLFELDRSDSFNSPARRRYEGSTLWNATGLTDNTRYYWRAKAYDGKADGEWVTGSFLVSSANEAPAVPVLRNLGPGSWTEARRPRFEVAPALDPEGGLVSYEFQVFTDPGLASPIAEGQSPQPAWLLPTTLVDGTTYYWRARALDAEGNASSWSIAAAFVVDTDPVFAPRLAFFSPQQVQLSGGGTLSIGIELRDPENQPQLSLYFDRDDTGVDGTEIVKDLALDPAQPAATYAWNTAALPPGKYHVYGVLNNGQRTTVAYAPGIVMIPAAAPRGSVILKTTSTTALSELGGEGTFKIELASPPSADVTIGLNTTRPLEGRVTPAQVTFTPATWSTPQVVTVKGLNDCIVDGRVPLRLIAAKAISSDIDYAGVKGNELDYTNADDDSPTSLTTLATCNLKLVSSKPITIREVEYAFTVDLTNLGAALQGVTGTVTSSSPTTKIVEGNLSFGPAAQGATVTSQDTFTIRQNRTVLFDPSKLNWTLTPVPVP